MIKAKNVRFIDKGQKLGTEARTGISLHCHTMHSKEVLDFVPYYAERIPIVSYLWQRELRRSQTCDGRRSNFDSGFWTPPLTGEKVFEMESDQMASLGLEGIVSITDHDSIDANLEISDRIGEARAPISMEWTVPFREAFFHIGVHNLPAKHAPAITRQLLDHTYAAGEPDDKRLGELFAMLIDLPDVLLVLNHPIWDIEMIGQLRHEHLLERFVTAHGKWLHAIEINGFRAWHENEAAIELAERLGMPIISGGDRHCLHSNTMINVSNAETFAEFVHEIRVEGRSRIAVTPEYKIPLPARQVASIAQILGNFQHFPEGRRMWSDRIYFATDDGTGPKTLTEHWGGHQPFWAHLALGALAVMSHPLMRPVIGIMVGDNDIGRDDRHTEPGFAIGSTPIIAENLRTQ